MNDSNIPKQSTDKKRDDDASAIDLTSTYLVGSDAGSTNASNLSNSRVIGHYKLLQLIATGGMGQVWMAEQEKPVRRQVALKLIKAGMDSKPIVARFEAERQALAMMDHPNIAKVLDAGTTDEGQPYFVMELVHGVPITNFCDTNNLGINERLDLFISVCIAVQHAHQKGIIHRDLKPSNILVALNDGRPMVKVIDFGLAKALEHQSKLTERTLFTEFGQVMGTLQYMSPEQAEMNSVDVDTRSDIYALGVVLYELLTGSTPIERDMLERQALLEVLEAIRELDPPRPSVRLSGSGEKIAGISRQRQINPQRLSLILRGDLDWIVMKALDKDRARRYESANGFAEDLRRYLEGDVIKARPPSNIYRLKKFVKKNRTLVLGAGAFVSLLMITTIVASVLGIVADSARRVARNAEGVAESQKKLALQEADNAKKAFAKTQAALARSSFFLAQSRWNENRASETQNLLRSVPKENRHVEWKLAQRMYDGGYMTLYGHSQSVTSVSFSPDGTRIASSSSDHSVKLWDARNGSELLSLKGHRGPVNLLQTSSG